MIKKLRIPLLIGLILLIATSPVYAEYYRGSVYTTGGDAFVVFHDNGGLVLHVNDTSADSCRVVAELYVKINNQWTVKLTCTNTGGAGTQSNSIYYYPNGTYEAYVKIWRQNGTYGVAQNVAISPGFFTTYYV